MKIGLTTKKKLGEKFALRADTVVEVKSGIGNIIIPMLEKMIINPGYVAIKMNLLE